MPASASTVGGEGALAASLSEKSGMWGKASAATSAAAAAAAGVVAVAVVVDDRGTLWRLEAWEAGWTEVGSRTVDPGDGATGSVPDRVPAGRLR